MWLLFACAAAHAGPATSSLSWVRMDGAERCLTAPQLATAVESRLGRTVFVPPAQGALAVEGRAERIIGEGGTTWRAVLRLADASGAALGERVVESHTPGCEELGAVVVLTLALMIDPDAAALPPDPPPPEPTPPEPAPPPPPAPASAFPTAPKWRFEVQTALTGGAGMVPGIAIGGRAVGIATPPGFVPFLIEGETLPFARAEVAGVRADFTRVVGGLALCPLAVDQPRFVLLACLGVDAGAIFVLDSSIGLGTTEWVLVQGHASLRPRWVLVGPLTLQTGLHVFVPFRPVAFATSEGINVYTPWPVAGLLDLGVGLSF